MFPNTSIHRLKKEKRPVFLNLTPFKIKLQHLPTETEWVHKRGKSCLKENCCTADNSIYDRCLHRFPEYQEHVQWNRSRSRPSGLSSLPYYPVWLWLIDLKHLLCQFHLVQFNDLSKNHLSLFKHFQSSTSPSHNL